MLEDGRLEGIIQSHEIQVLTTVGLCEKKDRQIVVANASHQLRHTRLSLEFVDNRYFCTSGSFDYKHVEP